MKTLIAIIALAAAFTAGWFTHNITTQQWALEPTPSNVLRINTRTGDAHILDTKANQWRELGRGINEYGAAPTVRTE